jgi:hypothetical protein
MKTVRAYFTRASISSGKNVTAAQDSVRIESFFNAPSRELVVVVEKSQVVAFQFADAVLG